MTNRTEHHHDPPSVDRLLAEWESGELDHDGAERLRKLLREDADARSDFLRLQMITASLRLNALGSLDAEQPQGGAPAVEGHSAAGPHAVATRRDGPPAGRRGLGFWAAAAAAVVMCLHAGWLATRPPRAAPPRAATTALAEDLSNHGRGRDTEAKSQGVALVTRLVGVVWPDGQSAVEIGDALSVGRFKIASGHAQVEFFGGASVVVEGPADLELVSSTLVRCREGRLRAHVPPAAQGFSIDLDGLRVVDLGTEFGLSVSGETVSVQVFEGEVELHPAERAKRLLTAGQAVLRTATGDYQPADAEPEGFVGLAGLASRAERDGAARLGRWRSWSQRMRRDPRLIAYYAFDQQGDWRRRLRCDNEPADRLLDGAVVGAKKTEGRWPGKQSLEFKQPADRVRLQAPGEHGSLTLACWVKIDSLDRWYNSLFLTDGYNQGNPHWQVLDTGQLYFSVRAAARGATGATTRSALTGATTGTASGAADFKALSPSFWEPSLIGKWTHLAVACDLRARVITHYVNGQTLSRHTAPPGRMPPRARIGYASIGNWALPTKPDADFAIRNLNGCVDELIILSAALSAEEIEEMYLNGKP